MKVAPHEVELARVLYLKGFTLQEVGAKLGRSAPWVRSRLVELGVPRRHRGARGPLGRTVKLYREALDLRNRGLTLAEIGKRNGVSRQRIHQILAQSPE